MAKGFLSGLAAGLVVVAGLGVAVSQLAPQVPRAVVAAAPDAEPMAGSSAPAAASASAPAVAAPLTADPPVVALAAPAPEPADTSAAPPPPEALASAEPTLPAPTAEPVVPAVAPEAAAEPAMVPTPGATPLADAAPKAVVVILPQPATTDIIAALPVTPDPAETPAPVASRDQPAAAGKPPGTRLPNADTPNADTPAGARPSDAPPTPVVGTEPVPAQVSLPVGVTGARVVTEALAKVGGAAPVPVVPGADPVPLADAAPPSAAQAPVDVTVAEAGTGDADAALPEIIVVKPIRQPVEKPGILVLTKPGMPGSATAPQPGFGRQVPGVRRVQPDRAVVAPDPAALPDAAVDAQPALRRNAAICANPDGKPLFSVILIDDGQGDRAKVTGLGFPVTVALDPTAADAAQAEAAYRSAGLEVLILAGALPEGATAADMEVAFQSYFNSLPGALAVLDLPLAGVQGNRVMAQQMVAILGDSGYGLVTLDRGLAPAAQVATRERVAQARIFRELDGDSENVATMRRVLDRAAFRAAQEGSVVVLGHARDATLQALVEWAAEGRAGNMALCPISGVMTAG